MQRLSAVAIVLAASLAGCHKPPAIVLERPVRMEQLAPGVVAPASDFALLADVKTTGRFSCTLAIARFTPAPGDADALPTFGETPAPEQAYWLRALLGVEAIREIEFLRPINTRPEGQSLADLCDAAHRLGAALLLAYAPARTGPNAAQVVGVLFEVDSQRALATFNAADRRLDKQCAETALDAKHKDLRTHDARWQAQRQFEIHVRNGLREMIHRDAPAPTTQPHDKWETPIERWWIHYR